MSKSGLTSLRFNAVSAKSISGPVEIKMTASRGVCLTRDRAVLPSPALLTEQPAQMRESSMSLQPAVQTSKTLFTYTYRYH